MALGWLNCYIELGHSKCDRDWYVKLDWVFAAKCAGYGQQSTRPLSA